jgi:hypothetical protein
VAYSTVRPRLSHSLPVQPGEKLRAEIPNIEINILGVADASSAILQVTDVKSGTMIFISREETLRSRVTK